MRQGFHFNEDDWPKFERDVSFVCTPPPCPRDPVQFHVPCWSSFVAVHSSASSSGWASWRYAFAINVILVSTASSLLKAVGGVAIVAIVAIVAVVVVIVKVVIAEFLRKSGNDVASLLNFYLATILHRKWHRHHHLLLHRRHHHHHCHGHWFTVINHPYIVTPSPSIVPHFVIFFWFHRQQFPAPDMLMRAIAAVANWSAAPN